MKRSWKFFRWSLNHSQAPDPVLCCSVCTLPHWSPLWPAGVCLVCWPTAAWPQPLSSSAASSEPPAIAATLVCAGQNIPEDKSNNWWPCKQPNTCWEPMFPYTTTHRCFIWVSSVADTYPNSPQQANVVSQQFLKDEEVAGCLLLMQLLHLVLQLCQLGQSPGQGCVVLGVPQHGHAFCKYCCVPT